MQNMIKATCEVFLWDSLSKKKGGGGAATNTF